LTKSTLIPDSLAEARPSQHHVQHSDDGQCPEGLGPGRAAQPGDQIPRADRIRRRPVRSDEDDALEGEGHSERRDERRYVELDGDQTVDAPDRTADHQRQDQAQENGETRIVEVRDEKGRKHVHLTHRQIDLSQDQDRDLGEREEGDGCDEAGQRRRIGGCEEVRGIDSEEQHQCEHNHGNDQLLQVLVH
jgi:hypothetical protein